MATGTSGLIRRLVRWVRPAREWREIAREPHASGRTVVTYDAPDGKGKHIQMED